MISVYDNSIQKWIWNLFRNVATRMIFNNIDISYRKSIHFMGCLTIIVNIFIIFFQNYYSIN